MRATLSLLDPAQLDKVTDHHKHYVNPLRDHFLDEGITCPLKKCKKKKKKFRRHLPPTRGVGYLNRFQGRLLPYTNTGTVQEISEISRPGSELPVQSTAIWFVHSTHGVHCSSKGGETDGHTQGYKDPPVPRRLVSESQIPPGLSLAYSRSSENMPRTRLTGELRKVRLGAQAGLRFCRLPVRPQGWSGPTDTGPMAEPTEQIWKMLSLPACPVRQFMSLIC